MPRGDLLTGWRDRADGNGVRVGKDAGEREGEGDGDEGAELIGTGICRNACVAHLIPNGALFSSQIF